MESESNAEQDMILIKEEIIPNLVHERYFCRPRSREFVELIEVDVRPMPDTTSKYRCLIHIEFSGDLKRFIVACDTSFDDADDSREKNVLVRALASRYDKFDIFPKYVVLEHPAEPERLVMVCENREELAIICIGHRVWYKEETFAIAEVLAKFHAQGMRLIKEDPDLAWIDRDRCNKVTFVEGVKSPEFEKFARETMREILTKADSADAKGCIKKFDEMMDGLAERDLAGAPELRTIVQGNILRHKVALKQTVGPYGMRFLDWTRIELFSSCSLDLAMLLFQTPVKSFKTVHEVYCKALLSELEVPLDRLKEEIETIGFLYALYTCFRERKAPTAKVMQKFLSGDIFA